MRPGRHGSMSNGELEQIIIRNGNFISVRRAGSGDGYVGVYEAVSGKFILGINGGRLAEFSRMANPKWGCECSPKAFCKKGIHGTDLRRGWRNILSELVGRTRVRPTPEIRRILGDQETRICTDYGNRLAPEGNPVPEWDYRQLRSA